MNDYDMACRRMGKAEPATMLRWLFDDFDEVAERVGWVDTRRIAFPGKGDQTGDLVFTVRARRVLQALWALAVEFQIEPDPEMFGRMMIYLGTIWLEQRPDPDPGNRFLLASCVVNLTGTPASLPASANFIWPGSDKVECVLAVRERWLSQESAQMTLERVASGRYHRLLLPWIPLMRGGSDPAVVARTLELAGEEPDEGRRASIGYDLLVFAEKSVDPGVWQKALEGWSMVKSPFVEKTRNEARTEGLKEGRTEGLKEGRTEGLKEGLKEGRAEAILECVRRRTKQEPPQDIADKVRGCDDLDVLHAWFGHAVDSSTLDEFRKLAGM